MRALTSFATMMIAEPPMTMLREAKAPKPSFTYSVEPWKTPRMRFIGTPSASAAICENTVSSPCPFADEPV